MANIYEAGDWELDDRPSFEERQAGVRADGWPLCPQCGEDEVWSTFRPSPPDYRGTLEQYLSETATLRCYRCGWAAEARAATAQGGLWNGEEAG